MRRARINESLNELKELVLDAMKKDVSRNQRETYIPQNSCILILYFFFLQASRYSKMEKADILEMTVKYLKTLHRDRRTPPTGETAAI